MAGIYLEDNPPARSQFRVGRRQAVRPVIVVHTAESGTDRSGPDPKAENVARFIQRRSDPGSYHLIGDTDSIIQLVRFENEAFHDGTGSNRWSIGISLAMNAADWPILTDQRRDALVGQAVAMALAASDWLLAEIGERPLPVRLRTKGASEAPEASGFIAHGDRDPRRRTDPGKHFPWALFLQKYGAAIGAPTTELNTWIVALQTRLNELGAQLAVDGLFGPRTAGAVDRHLDRSRRLALVEKALQA